LSAEEEITCTPALIICEIINSLPKGKAAGPDGILYEHLLYGNIAAIGNLLSQLLNTILSLSLCS
jgi:hypothetical protein